MKAISARRSDALGVVKEALGQGAGLVADMTQPPAQHLADEPPGAGGLAQPEPAGEEAPTDLSLEAFVDRLHLWKPLENLWEFQGRPEQKPPPGDWRTWLILGGRGSGKTRAGAEWVHAVASAGRTSDLRIALIAETLGDAREVMIDGMSGICRIARSRRPEFEVTRRRLVWPNGAMAQIFSSEDPESLRGPQFHLAWCDELHPCIVSEFSIPLIACFCE